MKRLFMLVIVAGMAATSLLAQADGAASPEALLKQVFAALEQKDNAALERLAISPDEFKKFVWPSVTAPPTGTTPEKFYKMYTVSSGVGIADSLKLYGGRKTEVLKVTLDPPRKQAKNYRLLPGAEVSIRDESGQDKTVRMLGGVLEHDGRYKVATYYVRPQSGETTKQ